MAEDDTTFEEALAAGDEDEALEEYGDEELAEALVDSETEYDLLFPTIPLEDDPSPPEADDLQLVDDLADFAADELADVEDDPLVAASLGDDFAIDWTVEEFFADEQGDPLRVSDDDAVIEWAEKALRVARGEYAIYPPAYGTTIHQFIGQGLPSGVVRAQVSDSIVSCLSLHPRITDVIVQEVGSREGESPDILFVTALIYIDGGEDPIPIEVRN